MNKYEVLNVAGEGSYGVVVRARHKGTGKIVAIKKISDFEGESKARKVALREIDMLKVLLCLIFTFKRLHHENIVNLLDYFSRKSRLYLIFEYVENTILSLLETHPTGLEEVVVKRFTYQIIRGVQFCHENDVSAIILPNLSLGDPP